MGKHHDKDKEEAERRQQGNGQVPPDMWVSRKEPKGKHSAPEAEEDPEEEEDGT